MKNEINAVLENMTTTAPEPEDYTGEDGLLYCGKCRKPKEAYFAPDKAAIFGRDRHPAECDCQRTAREEREAAEKRRRHLDTVEELKRRGFTDPTMRDWTFENEINAVLENMTATAPEPENYTGEDGLLYCGKCRKPKEAYFAPDKAAIFGRDRHPAECDCQRAAREEREAAEKRRRHLDTVEELKRRGFTDPTMRGWTFENDNGRNPQAGIARRYVEHWEDMRTDNIGCLFWGGVGTGKSYQNYAAALRIWAGNDKKKAPKKGIPDYSCKEGESL